MVCFDWKIGVFQQTVVRVYCILKVQLKRLQYAAREKVNNSFSKLQTEGYLYKKSQTKQPWTRMFLVI